MTADPRPSVHRLAAWRDEVRIYWNECVGVRDFARLIRVRLSQSKIGRWTTPDSIVVELDLRTLGPAVRLRSHTTDISVLKELLVGNSYEPLPADEHVGVVIDLGANVGLSFRWLRSRYPGARFVCVEPDPGNLEILRANVRSVDPDAAIHEACIGGRARQVSLVTGAGEWGYRMSDISDGADVPSAGGDIDVTTMDTLLAASGVERIGVLKCDIEGAEAEVFADCRSWIDRVDAMSVECHTDVLSTEDFLRLVADNGGRFTVTHLEANPHLGFDIVTLERDDSPERELSLS
jgi:FkbM family methyltransferase